MQHLYVVTISGYDFEVVIGICTSLEDAVRIIGEHRAACVEARTYDAFPEFGPWAVLEPGGQQTQVLRKYIGDRESISDQRVSIALLPVNQYGGRWGFNN